MDTVFAVSLVIAWIVLVLVFAVLVKRFFDRFNPPE
jgi:hypothetical protein